MPKIVETIPFNSGLRCIGFENSNNLIVKDLWLRIETKTKTDLKYLFEKTKNQLFINCFYNSSDKGIEHGIIFKNDSENNFLIGDIVFFNESSIKSKKEFNEATFNVIVDKKDCFMSELDCRENRAITLESPKKSIESFDNDPPTLSSEKFSHLDAQNDSSKDKIEDDNRANAMEITDSSIIRKETTVNDIKVGIITHTNFKSELSEDLYKLFRLTADYPLEKLFKKSSKYLFIGTIKEVEGQNDLFQCYVLKTDEEMTYPLTTTLIGYKYTLTEKNKLPNYVYIDDKDREIYFVEPSELFTADSFNSKETKTKTQPKKKRYPIQQFIQVIDILREQERKKSLPEWKIKAIDYYFTCKSSYKFTDERAINEVLKKYSQNQLTKADLISLRNSRRSRMRDIKPSE